MRSDIDFDKVAAAWKRWFPYVEAAAHPISERLVLLAGIGPGAHVLDIGTGLGEPALTAARAAGSTGRVIALDVAPAMLTFARDRAREARLDNVEFVEGDAGGEIPSGPFDAIVSRWGLMFLEDLDAALARYRRHLRRGGRLAMATWAAPDEVPQISTPTRIAAKLGLGQVPPIEGGPFSLSDPVTLKQRLEACGYANVTFEPFDMALRLKSAAMYFDYVSDMSVVVRALIGSIDRAELQTFQDAVESEIATRFTEPGGGIRITNRAYVTVASNP